MIAKNTTNIRLIEMMKTSQDLRMKFKQEIETLKTQSEMKMELKTPKAMLENPKETLTVE